jgi:hypothetical protein
MDDKTAIEELRAVLLEYRDAPSDHFVLARVRPGSLTHAIQAIEALAKVNAEVARVRAAADDFHALADPVAGTLYAVAKAFDKALGTKEI